jgi:transcriptional regulator with XRE-family HTH domain
MTTVDVSAARERVRAWIAASGMSKAAIADAADVDEKTVRQAAGHDWNPTVNTLAKLAAIVPAEWQAPPKRRRAA